MNAALNDGEQRRTYCGTMRSPWNTGSSAARGRPVAEQCTTTWPGGMASSPCANTMRSRSTACTWPSRTTRPMRRSCASSASLTVAQRYIVGSTFGSMRSSSRRASSRANKSGNEAASRATSSSDTMASSVVCAKGRVGWMCARLSSHASRGRTQVMVSGSAPCSSSHSTVSMEVLPPPTITCPRAGSPSCVSSVGVTQRTPSATRKRGPCVAGTWLSARAASTHLRRAVSCVRRPLTSEVATPSAPTSCRLR